MTPKMLAEAIRKGHTMIGEGTRYMPPPSICQPTQDEMYGCALCAAWLGAGRGIDEYWKMRDCNTPAEAHFAQGLEISVELADEINRRHIASGSTNRLAIADWLDTLDVSKPKDAQSFNDFMKVVTQPVELEAA